MGDEVKKISFGFSKLVKKTCIISSNHSQIKQEDNKVEFIDCLEGKSIKLKDPVKAEEKELVIPLKRELKDKVSAKESDTNNWLSKAGNVGQQDSNHIESTDIDKLGNLLPIENDKSKLSDAAESTNDTRPKCETLDEIATREILEDLKKEENAEETRIFTVPLLSTPATGEKESSLEDYENIPVNDFGLAMLRGMGWAPGKGIGKNEKLVAPSMPTLRPKGMGLGADKVIKAAVGNKADIEDLTLTKGSFVRVLAGIYKDCYGQIEGFDDESCRLIVKIALKNTSVSLNEFMVQLVDKGEFTKNSKVINVGKYEQYKKDDKGKKSNQESLPKTLRSEERFEEQNYKYPGKSKDSKSHKDYSNPTSSESENLDKPIKKTSVYISKSHYKGKESPRESKIKSGKIRSRSSSRSTDEIYTKQIRSRSSSRSTDEIYKKQKRYSRSLSKSRLKNKHNCHKERSNSRHHSRHSSGSSDRKSSSSGYSRKRKSSYKKRSNSHKHKSRSHSRSPRKHSSYKKHKKYK